MSSLPPPEPRPTAALLLDLPDLEAYLLSLLAHDLSEATHWAGESWNQVREAVPVLLAALPSIGARDAGLETRKRTRTRRSADSSPPGPEVATALPNRGQRSTSSSSWSLPLPLSSFRPLVPALVLSACTVLASGSTGPASASLVGRGLSLSGSGGSGAGNGPSGIRRRLLVYALLRGFLPELYRIAVEHLAGAAAAEDAKDRGASDADGSATTGAMRRLAARRRLLVLRWLVRFLDGALLPGMRLALLLSCWGSPASTNGNGTGRHQTHAGNLSLWWSGLSYGHNGGLAGQTPNTNNNTIANNNTKLVPLFVLYAHRRWLHRVGTELWTTVSGGLSASGTEVIDLVRYALARARPGPAPLGRWRRRWAAVLPRTIVSGEGASYREAVEASSSSIEPAAKPGAPCSICGAAAPVVPYRVVVAGCWNCCGSEPGETAEAKATPNTGHTHQATRATKVACYTCLWEALATAAAASGDGNENENENNPGHNTAVVAAAAAAASKGGTNRTPSLALEWCPFCFRSDAEILGCEPV